MVAPPTVSTNRLGDSHVPSGISSAPAVALEVGLLTGGVDKPYAFGLGTALVSRGVGLDFIGSDEIDSPQFDASPKLRFLNLRGDQDPNAPLAIKIFRIMSYYSLLLRYAWSAQPKIFHILWNNKFQIFDRTLLMLYYKLLRKKIVFTAHNVNAGKRDLNDSFLNRITLRIQYQLADHIFVHTEKMKGELLRNFGVREDAVSVIPFGINNAVPDTDLTPAQARQWLGIAPGEKTILFFGSIVPYKGLDVLAEAFQRLPVESANYRLIVAGKPGKGCEDYLAEVQQILSGNGRQERVLQRLEFIPDEETEIYFKAADILVLPYTHVFQSGVLFLGYSFGLPVVATDVGSLADEVIRGRTGLLCKSGDADDLARAIESYFASAMYLQLDLYRRQIRDYANERNSWDVVSETTINVYRQLLADLN